MKEYTVEVKETLHRLITVEANSMEEAVSIVSEQYDKEEIVLDYDDYAGYEIVPYEDGK